MAGPVLLGREQELERLQAAATLAAAGEGRLVLVVGETGIGKTTLVGEFSRRADAAGSRVVQATTPGGQLPYAPLVDAIRASLARYGPDLVAGLPAHQVRELARLVPEIPAASPDHAPPGTELAELRLFEALVGWLRQLATASAPGVLVLDDIQAADPSTAAFMAYMASVITSSGVLVLATARAQDLDTIPWLRQLFVDLARRDPRSLIELHPLAPHDTRTLAERRLGQRGEGALLDLIVTRSAGNPYFAEELARHAADGQGDVPSSLKALILERLRALSDAALRVAQLAAAHGPHGSIELLEAAARLPPPEAARAVRETRAQNLLTLEHDRWSFRHPVVAEVIYGELLPAERRQLHQVLAESLAARAPEGNRSPAIAVALARHWYEAGRADEAFPALLAAAGAAEDVHAFTEADQLYERALSVVPHVGARSDRRIGFRPREDGQPSIPADLLPRAAAAASYAGRPRRAAELLEASFRDSPPTGNQLLLRERLGRYLLEAGDGPGSLAIYEAASRDARDADGPIAARVLGGYARALQVLGRHEEGGRIAEQAVSAAVDAHAVVEEFQARSTLGACLAATGRVEDGLRELAAARRLQELIGSPSRLRSSRIIDVLSGYLGAAWALDRAGQADASAQVAAEGRAAAERLGVRGVWGGLLGSVAAAELFDLGRWTEAADLATRLAAAGGEEASAALVIRARMLVARGLADEATRELSAVRPEAIRGPGSSASFFSAAAELGIAQGDLDGARRAIEGGLAEVGAGGDRLAVAQLAALGLRIDAERAAAARVRRASADLTELHADADLLRSLVARGEEADKPSATKQAAYELLAEGEFVRVDGRAGPDQWEQVVAAFDHLRAPYMSAYGRLRWGEALLAESGRRADAERVLRHGLAAAEELGAVPLVREIEALARRARLDLAEAATQPAAPSAEPSPAEQLGLSPREVEVLGLLVEGKTNREIAEALFITEKTAGHHVSSILGKLGVRGRVEAAAAAIQLGIGSDSSADAVPGATHDPSDRPTRAFLFTDIANSTSLVAAIGDRAWAHLSAWHDSTLRGLFARNGGEEIDHAGDGFFVTFRSASAAIDCAIAIQRTLAAHRRSQGFAPQVRIGIHAGRAVEEGPALRGRAVHEASRIAALAGPDEILVSQTALAATRRSYRVLERRRGQLRGLSEPAELATIAWS